MRKAGDRTDNNGLILPPLGETGERRGGELWPDSGVSSAPPCALCMVGKLCVVIRVCVLCVCVCAMCVCAVCRVRVCVRARIERSVGTWL